MFATGPVPRECLDPEGNSVCDRSREILEEHAYSTTGEQRMRSDTLSLMRPTTNTGRNKSERQWRTWDKEKREVDQGCLERSGCPTGITGKGKGQISKPQPG